MANNDAPEKKGELTGLAKLAYKPFGIVFGLLGGLLAGRVFGMIWKRISKEDDTPQPLSEDYTTREVLLAATIQGAIFGLIKTAVDRYGMKGVRRFLDAPRPPSDRPAA
jgi:nitrate reductase gamma subunit